MDKLVCRLNQSDVDNGDIACTAIAACYVRLVLEAQPGSTLTREDLVRAIKAGAFLCGIWKGTDDARRFGLQCWTDVRATFPDLFEGLVPTYEGSGQFGVVPEADDAFGRVAFSQALAEFEAFNADGTPAVRAGILTAAGRSFGLARRGAYWYVFDSHPRPGATLHRSVGRVLLARYLTRELLQPAAGRRFHVTVFGLAAGPGGRANTPGTPRAARTTRGHNPCEIRAHTAVR
jgi:hypothetical protein